MPELQQGISRIELRLSVFWLVNLITVSLGEHQNSSYPFILQEIPLLPLIPLLFHPSLVSKNKFTLLTKFEPEQIDASLFNLIQGA